MTPHHHLAEPCPWTGRPVRLLVFWVAVLALIAAGCADDDDVAVTDPTVEDATPATTPDQDASPMPEEATPQPTTADDGDGIEIDVACVDGEPVTTPLPISDIEEIDDVVNTIDFCEGVGGLASVGFTAPCPSGDRDVIVVAVGGALPDIATLDLCENET